MAIRALQLRQRGVYRSAKVIVFNADGQVNRTFDITVDEFMALRQPGAGAPRGVTAREHSDARWRATAHTMTDPGDMEVSPEESVTIFLSRRGGLDIYATFSREEYTGIPPAITIESQDLEKIPLARRPSSIVAGVMEDDT